MLNNFTNNVKLAIVSVVVPDFVTTLIKTFLRFFKKSSAILYIESLLTVSAKRIFIFEFKLYNLPKIDSWTAIVPKLEPPIPITIIKPKFNFFFLLIIFFTLLNEILAFDKYKDAYFESYFWLIAFLTVSICLIIFLLILSISFCLPKQLFFCKNYILVFLFQQHYLL